MTRDERAATGASTPDAVVPREGARVLVFGAGSLGSLLGGLLARTHDVTLVGRDPHVAAVREGGLRIDGAVSETVSPAAATSIPGGRFDLALVTVKAHDTPAAAAALATHEGRADSGDRDDGGELGAVWSLQNGLGNEERLAAALSSPVLAGTCTYGARLVDPGVVECTGVGEVTVGPPGGGESALADAVGAAATAAGVEATVATDMPRRLWEKLAVNAGINAVTALARVDNGALVDGPAGEPARAAARETARVAREAGVDLDPAACADRVTDVAETTAANVSSMRADVETGRPTEVDAINGAVVERASVPVPVNETLTALVRAWERERGLR
ncbi:MAG: ketopantoate reductase family protein [Haloarculaceae archaeon]